MGRAPCCDKANVKKGPWSPEEDAKLKEYIEKHGTGGNWIALPQKIGLRRCGKSCRLRWLNYLRPNIKHGEFSDDEDRIIYSLFSSIGSRWSIIAAQLPGRTDNDIKNYWNTKLKKKLMGNSMAPSTQYQKRPHQPTIYPTPPNNSLLQEPSSISSPYSSLNSQIPSSYEYDNMTNYCYNSTPFRAFSRIYYDDQPISPNFTTDLISSNSIDPDGFVGPARDNYDNQVIDRDGKNNLLTFGGDHQDLLCSQSYFSNGVDDGDNQKFLLSTNHGYSSSLSSSSTAANDGRSFSGNPLDYSIEEIKQLISTNNMCNNYLNCFVDEIIKTEED